MKDEATEDGKLRVALIGHRGGRALRAIADGLYGAARVVADWDADNWTRARTRRLVRKAHGRARREKRDGVAEAAGDE